MEISTDFNSCDPDVIAVSGAFRLREVYGAQTFLHRIRNGWHGYDPDYE